MINIIKNIILLPVNIIKLLIKGFYNVALLISTGFYTYPKYFFLFIKKIFNLDNKSISNIINHFEKRKYQPEVLMLILIYIVSISTFINIFYAKKTIVVDNSIYIDEVINTNKDNNKTNDIDSSNEDNNNINNNSNNTNNNNYTETNLYKRYQSTSLNNVNINTLKKANNDTIGWLSVDKTNINYPVVQTTNNDYYLKHSFDLTEKSSGWIFMDYRNNIDNMSTNNIIYGHNLLNKTAFGSLSNLFTNSWLSTSNKTIILLSNTKRYIYKIFSVYTIEPETYYLQTDFTTDMDKTNFINTINNRNTISLGESATKTDKILTLSTCTDDNKGRKVVHAKLISEENR